MTKKSYPECEKLQAVAPHSQKIGEFIDWCAETKSIGLVIDPLDSALPVYTPLQQLLAEFFEIDMNKVELERQEILKDLQSG